MNNIVVIFFNNQMKIIIIVFITFMEPRPDTLTNTCVNCDELRRISPRRVSIEEVGLPYFRQLIQIV